MSLDIQTAVQVRDGVLTIGRTQDCTAIAEHTRALSNEGMHGSADLKHVGLVPFVMVEKYCNDNNILFSELIGNPEHIKRICNDPAMAHFRIWKGRL